MVNDDFAGLFAFSSPAGECGGREWPSPTQSPRLRQRRLGSWSSLDEQGPAGAPAAGADGALDGGRRALELGAVQWEGASQGDPRGGGCAGAGMPPGSAAHPVGGSVWRDIPEGGCPAFQFPSPSPHTPCWAPRAPPGTPSPPGDSTVAAGAGDAGRRVLECCCPGAGGGQMRDSKPGGLTSSPPPTRLLRVRARMCSGSAPRAPPCRKSQRPLSCARRLWGEAALGKRICCDSRRATPRPEPMLLE